MEYAVRGQIVLRANEHEAALRNGEERPFDDVVLCNIGNPQSVGQQPLTFARQVLALCMCPSFLEDDAIVGALPADVVARAQLIVQNSDGLGAYSGSKGLDVVRDQVAEFMLERDGFPADIEHIFLTNGASEGVKTILNLLIRGEQDGVLVPIPQYPLYSAGVTLLGGTMVPYYLDESAGWQCTVDSLQAARDAAAEDGVDVRALAVINPGNPTGQVLPRDNIADILAWCEREGVALLADEVYQTNVYEDDLEFVSFKKVLCELAAEGACGGGAELVSFHSTSKGFFGECGLRGGYMELVNVPAETVDHVYKSVSISLCSNIAGQVAVGLMTMPPAEGDESYPLYAKERDAILHSLRRRAEKLVASLNGLEGVTCNPSQGAMYAFPRVRFPERFVAHAAEQGVAPDAAYCLELLDATGICVVPGSGFGQEEGTFHFRTTFLPPEDKMDAVASRLSVFHGGFMAQWA